MTSFSELQAWVEECSANAPAQHSPEWLAAKKYLIGGSSMATITGDNKYTNIETFVRERLAGFKSFIAVFWGNMFEDVIKAYCEHVLQSTIIGDDLFLRYNDYIAFSPDGLTITKVKNLRALINCGKCDIDVDEDAEVCVLLEFKCPFSRIPYIKPPVYYVPQVKMGLDIIDHAKVGVLVEAVYRLCAWDDFDLTLKCSEILQERAAQDGQVRNIWSRYDTVRSVKALGLIGVYYRPEVLESTRQKAAAEGNDELLCYIKYLDDITSFHDEGTNDLVGTSQIITDENGAQSGSDFINWIISNTAEANVGDKSGCIFRSCHLPAIYLTENEVGALDEKKQILVDKFLYEEPPETNDKVALKRLGLIPWKLFKVHGHYISKEPGYLAPYLEKIKQVIEIIRECDKYEGEERDRRITELCSCFV